MTMFRKFGSMFVLASAFTTLVACNNAGDGGNDTLTNTPSTGENKTQQTIDTTDGLPAMTTENITLTYASWDNAYMNEYLAEKFMEKYPNITVELVELEQATWNEGLFNLASTGNLPDVFWYLGDVSAALDNHWLLDFSAYYNADEENEKIPASIKEAGTFGDLRLSAPVKNLPFAVFLDRTVFEKLNIPMPSVDWTYSEMIELAKKLTVPEQSIYGMNLFTQLTTISPIVNQETSIGEFGWNGESFDFSVYAEAYEQQREFSRTGVFPPAFGSEEAAQAFGDAEVWAAATGQLGMQVDAIWTANLFETAEFKDKGIDMVIYPVPNGDNSSNDNKPCYVDFGGISSVTEHPREAYELLKWMGWGKEGWMHKIDAFETLTYEDGSKVYTYPDGVPLLDDSEIWEAYKTLVPQTEEWMAFLDSVHSPVAMGGTYIPGFQSFLTWMGEQDIFGRLDRDEIKASDIQEEIKEQANKIVHEATEKVLQNYSK